METLETSKYDFDLNEDLIAQIPHQKREYSKMMQINRKTKNISSHHFYNIVDFLGENDILVLNNTKVIKARIIGFKDKTNAKIEVFLLKHLYTNYFECLIKPSKRVNIGTNIIVSENFNIEIVEKYDLPGKWKVNLKYFGTTLNDIINIYGTMPLPPYIERKMLSEQIKNIDNARYQTVFAKTEGSVAAPTAGLHFSNEILEKLKKKNVEICYITLNVGLGTFRPVKCDNILEHQMDFESFEITHETAQIINNGIKNNKNIVACGTTVVRTLESVYKKNNEIIAQKDESNLFIYPGFEFKVVNKLITNFHLPKSTLLMLVCAFCGDIDFVLNAYKKAMNEKYRFYSYGDCMFIE